MTRLGETEHVQKLCDSIADAINKTETTAPYVITALELMLFDYKKEMTQALDFSPDENEAEVRS